MGRVYHKLSLRLGIAWALCSLGLTAGAAPGIAVIVARDGPDLQFDLATLRDVYLKKIFVDQAGDRLVPVNLPADNVLRQAFSVSLLHESSEGLQNYWNERYFHGVRPPYVLGSENAVLRFVAGTAGAIGYVAQCRVDASVRTVAVLTVPASARVAVEALCATSPGHP